MSRGIARLGDKTFGYCKIHKKKFPGKIITASNDTVVNGRGAVREGDIALSKCGHKGKVITHSSPTEVNGRKLARLGDKTTGIYIAKIISASSDSDDLQ